MGREIERRFLVTGEAWRDLGPGCAFRQGFLSTVKERVVRVRVAGERATLTIKGVTRGIAKVEFEYPIPLEDAQYLLDHLCIQPIIEKVRHGIEYAGLYWEVDEFLGENAGLVLAEVELQSEDQAVILPPWVGREISDDPRYFNSSLAEHPYRHWRDRS